MRIIIKYLVGVVILSVLFSCTGNFEKYNTEKYNIYKAEPSVLLPTMIDAIMYAQQNNSQMIDQMVGSLGGYFALAQRWGGTNFDTFNPSDGWNAIPWNKMFEDIYSNYFDIQKSTNESGHYWALARLVRGAVMLRVVDCYGPIPYSKVSNGQFYVAYDKAEDVYQGILKDLEYAASTLYEYTIAYPTSKPMATGDNIYGGDYTKWAKLANSLRMRVAMRVGDKQAFIGAVTDPAGIIEANSDNAMMSCGAQTNPYFIAANNWGDLRAASSIVDYMVGYKDPRMPYYFTPSQISGQTYIGLPIGQKILEKNISGPYSMPNFESRQLLPVFFASETAFLKAEAACKNWISENIELLYNQGIKLSMDFYGVDDGVSAAYIGNDILKPGSHQNDPSGNNYSRDSTITIAWNDSATDEQKLERIITQKWIANYPMGIEAWADFRRTGFPELQPSVIDLSGECPSIQRGMRRLKYPYTERSMNGENYKQGVILLNGTDSFFTDIFWAKKN